MLSFKSNAQFNFLKRDSDVETKTDELYPIKDMSQICSVE
jgi:sentrin-specific protease 1